MRRTGFTAIVVLGSLALLLAGAVGCAQQEPQPPPAGGGETTAAQPKRGGVLAGPFGEPAKADIHTEASIGGPSNVGQIHRGLITMSPEDWKTIVPDIAQRWEISPDGKTYTFFIRQGLKDSEGVPFNGEDVVYNIKRWQTRPNKMPLPRLACVGQSVQEAVLKDQYTVELRLKGPKTSFLPCLANHYALIQPKRILEPIDTAEKGRDVKPEELVGVGPFKLERWERGVSFEVVPNPNYWDYPQRPYLDRWTSYVFADTTAIAAAFRTEQIQFTGMTSGNSLRKGEFEETEQAMGSKVRPIEIGYPGFYSAHFNPKRPPFDNPEVRRAVYLAADRDLHNRLVYDGLSGLPSPFWSRWDNLFTEQEYLTWPGLRSYKGGVREEDLAEAKRLMEQQGYGPTTRVKVRYVTPAGGYGPLDAQLLVEQLKKIYIDLDIFRTQTGAELMAKGDFDIGLEGGTVLYDDPDDFIEVFYRPGGAKNHGNWTNAEFERLFQQETVEPDPAKRWAIIRQMAKIVAEDPPHVPLGVPAIRALVSQKVGGFVTPRSNQFGLRADYLWVKE
ncbi:MAG: ABC transporter substrate-binding protein [Chloroflexi bacterium]|nr:ABC transporter substrate-binding protein [Chloroflexota bacterium]